MQVGLAEACQITGKHASTITRAIRAGRLTPVTGDDGRRRFDVNELRCWAAVPQTQPEQTISRIAFDALVDAHQREIALWHERLRVQELRTEEIRQERDRLIAQAEDLRQLLQHIRAGEGGVASPAPEPEKKGWFRRT